MQEIMMEVLAGFQSVNGGKAPKRVIFFRDGVASGQFEKVREVEIKALKAALLARKIDAPLTFMVVQKRHHLRIFPTDNNMDKSGNCMPGTVIDTTITHPTECMCALT
jgi:eukaryotic translation initiation factor 2C